MTFKATVTCSKAEANDVNNIRRRAKEKRMLSQATNGKNFIKSSNRDLTTYFTKVKATTKLEIFNKFKNRVTSYTDVATICE